MILFPPPSEACYLAPPPPPRPFRLHIPPSCCHRFASAESRYLTRMREMRCLSLLPGLQWRHSVSERLGDPEGGDSARMPFLLRFLLGLGSSLWFWCYVNRSLSKFILKFSKPPVFYLPLFKAWICYFLSPYWHLHVTFAGLLFIDGYLVLKDQWTKQIISDIWGAKIWKRSQNSIVKFGKYCKLVFVSCFHYFFFCHNPYNEMELAFFTLKKKKKAHCISVVSMCSFWVFVKKKNA